MPSSEYNRGEEHIDLRGYLRVLVKRRWTIITVFAVIFITVAIHTFTATPIYQATTRLVIEKENPNVVSIEEVMAVDSSGTDYYQTQYKIIESRGVAREVISRLHLENSEEFFPKPKDDFISNIKRSVKETIQSWKDSIRDLISTNKEAETFDQKDYDSDSGLVSAFIDRIEVSPIRNSRLVDLSYEAKNPVLATQIVNTLAQAYMSQNLEIKLRAVKEAVSWLNKRVDEERKKVGEAEKALIQYKEKAGIITDFSNDIEQVTAQKLAQLNAQVVDAESVRVEAETRYNQAMSLQGSPDMLGSIPEVIQNELIGEINKMEVELYKRMSELSKKYGKKHPRMVAIESELKTLANRKAKAVNRVINSLRTQYRVALAKEESLKSAFNKQKQETLDLNKKAIQFSVLNREAQSARDMYDLLVKRFKETTLTEDMRTGNIRVVDRAEVPRSPVKPKKKLNLLLAIIVGLVAGIGLAFFFEYLDNTIKIPDEVKQHLRIPYLGPIPLVEEKDEKSGNRLADLVCLNAPKSTASESYRGIRTNILFSSAGAAPQVILVSSPGPREGKTMTATNLAITMAQSGSKVVLVDCDLRRPKIHRMFDLTKELGLTNLLVGNTKFGETVVHSKVSNLDLIFSGPVPPNPSEMLGSDRMKEFIGELRKHYDRIILDSPPITAVTDAAILGKIVDGVVLVIRAGQTVREVAKNSVSQLHSVGANVLGAVLNAVDIGKDKYYYYYYYQYYHYYYGDDGDKKKRRSKKRRKKRAKSAYYGREENSSET
ncbi:MAG: polysaccharide biosynthesis tyrosine autokinase, partial [Deltaproteobacteria bacterium]|nr:polysaccharide biosynthesis tyrosine autokinase [Deltaproteobacteria bacterium]